MITTEANSRTTPKRRSSGRPARGTRRTSPAIEGLEDRRLLSISITEFTIPTANSDPTAIAAGPDGNIWFTEPDQNQVARINPTTHVITEFPEPAGTGGLDSLVAAPDGFLYAIGRSSGSPDSGTPVSPLVQINPATGAMKEFQLENATDGPGNIAVGPDGNLWFTESDGIGMLNLKTFATSVYSTDGIRPYTIAKGPDGALWFTGSTFEIGRIDATTHSISEYSDPTSGAYPGSITAGPDGNMWFTESEYGTGQVGLINPTTHVFTEVPIIIPGVSDSNPEGITVGLGGNMWFTEDGSDQVTEIDVSSHNITNYQLPDSSAGGGLITLGPDGNLWFLDLNGNAVGEVSDSAVAQPLAASQTSVSSSSNPSTVGRAVTFTAVVTAASYQGTPTGTVTFTVDGQAQPPVSLALVGGKDQATFSIASLGAGTHTISAAYSGSSSFAASAVASPMVQTVKAVPARWRRAEG